MEIQLDKVPLRDPSLSPEEILMSESQERMCAIVEPKHIKQFMAICKKWDVTATVIGEVTEGERLHISFNGELIVDVPPRTVAHDGPVYNRPIAEPAYIKERANAQINIPMPSSASEVKAAILKLIASPNIADKSWVTSQYDKYVQGNSVLAQPEDSGMIRIDEKTNLGVAISTDANARWSYLNPYEGAKLALAESMRNIATTGAKPLAVTNCLNFGSPEDPGVMWQFAETVRGLADACLELGLPVTGGNVSFYNQTGKVAILPTPVIGVLGVIQDVRKRTPMGITKSGLDLWLIGKVDSNMSGSEWAYLNGEIGNKSPKSDLQMESRLVNLLLEGQELFEAAHDVSNGGLAATLVETVLNKKIGAKVTLDDLAVALFSETPGRVLVAVDPSNTNAIVALAGKYQIPIEKIGTTGGEALVVNDVTLSIAELSKAHTETFPKLFG
jgi:phosphoribosylformylglycinamidine synthase